LIAGYFVCQCLNCTTLLTLQSTHRTKIFNDMQQHHYPLAWLPNSHGFKFIGMLKNGRRIACEVVRDSATQMHSVAGAEWSELAGWVHV